MKLSRARIVPVLLLALGAIGVVALQSPASAAGVTSSNISTPTDGTHFMVTDSHPSSTTVTVSGTSNGTTGDFLDLRCYEVGSNSYQSGPTDVAVRSERVVLHVDADRDARSGREQSPVS